MDLRCAVSLPRGIALRWMVILSSTGFTGCGNSASFHSERREESLPIENKRPRGILRANSALRMTVFRFFPQPVKPVLPGPRRTNLPAICDKATRNFPEFLWEVRFTSRALQDIAHFRHCNLPPHVPAVPFPQPRLSFPRGHGWTSRICYPPRACSRALSVPPSPPPDRNFQPWARSERCRAYVPDADSSGGIKRFHQT